MTKQPFEEKKCKCCGKKVIVLSPEDWVYKRHCGGWIEYYCSWTCFRKTEKEKKRNYCNENRSKK